MLCGLNRGLLKCGDVEARFIGFQVNDPGTRRRARREEDGTAVGGFLDAGFKSPQLFGYPDDVVLIEAEQRAVDAGVDGAIDRPDVFQGLGGHLSQVLTRDETEAALLPRDFGGNAIHEAAV